MAKQLNVNLSFTADANQAKAQLRELQDLLSKITKTPSSSSSLGLTKDINSAINKVSELQAALQKATTNTGKLDLGQFHNELNKANLDAKKIAESLSKLGSNGQTAFAKLAQSVTSAEVPIRRTNTLLNEFATTLKNTARWQISSSILHGFMGSLQSAYGYSQRLNESLNNIRIVTGQSVDQMASFAKSANESAKALSTTTTAYTDAALIYYQQGLSDSEVKERTDVTIKMANVARESAEEVSNQMTAVWNNFNKDGDQSAEHFADVMTKLGAETASSTSEIAEGLSKFAGIADTVGLSFDYATSALATITATSRESADVVGTALKTIFGRMEGLKLGETLEDGTDLTKYSEALRIVGVDIKDASGQLKDMDTILDETGEAWQNLTEDQKVATAQTVAGVRQYSQFMTLMDNWDFMQENLARTQEADGTLQEQADIYAESWEAAQKRVQAAAQEIYSQLLDDKFFIKMTDAVASLLNHLSDVIDTMGGLKGVVAGLGTVFLNVFHKDIAQAIDDARYNFQLMTQSGREAAITQRTSFNDELIKMTSDMQEESGLATLYQQRAEAQNQLVEKTIELQALNSDISEQDQTKLKLLEDQNTALIQQYEVQAKITKDKRNKSNEAATNAIIDIGANQFGGKLNINTDDDYQKVLEIAAKNEAVFSRIQTVIAKTRTAFQKDIGVENIKNALMDLREQLSLTDDDFIGASEAVQKLWDKFLSFADNPSEKSLKDLQNYLRDLKQTGNESIPTFEQLIQAITETGGPGANQAISFLREYKGSIDEVSRSVVQEGEYFNNARNGINNYSKAIEEAQKKYATFGDKISGIAQGISSFAMVLSSLQGIIKTIQDPDMSGWDKFVSIMTSLGFMIPSLISSFNTLKGVLLSTSLAEKVVAADGTIMWSAILGPITLVIAGIAAVTAAIIVLKNHLEAISPEGQLEAAKEQAEQATTAYDELSNKVSEVNGAISEYENARNALSEMTTGTEEWTAAVSELNDKVIELIDKYPELAKGLDITNGVLSIDEQVMKDFTKELQKQQALLGVVKANANDLSKEQQAVDRKENYSNLNKVETGKTISSNYTITQSSLGMMYQPQLGQMYDSFTKKESLKDLISLDDYNSIMDAVKEKGTEVLENWEELANATKISADAAKIIAADDERGKDIRSRLSSEITDELTKQKEAEAQRTAAIVDLLNNSDNQLYNSLIGSENEDDKDLLNAVENIVTKKLSENSRRVKEELNALDQKSESEIEKLWSDLHNYQKNGDHYENEQGEEVKFDIDQAKQELAQVNAAEKLVENDLTSVIQGVQNALQSVHDKNEDYVNGVKDFITNGTADSFTSDQKDILMNSEDPAYLLGLSLEDIHSLGYKSGETFRDALIQAISESEGNVDRYFAHISEMAQQAKALLDESAQSQGEESFGSDLTNSEQIQLGGNLEEAANTSSLALESLTDLFSAGSEEALKFSNAISSIDWGSFNNAKEAADAIQASGGLSEGMNSEAVEEYAHQMMLAADAANNMKEVLDEDVDEGQMQALAGQLQEISEASDQLADSLKTDGEEAEEISEDLLRYNAALGKVIDRYDEWQDLLSSDNLMDNAEAVEELRNVYSDLLDLDSDSLSEGFLSSAENLDLLREAANGSEEAYEALQEAAAQDILMQCGIDTSQFDADKAWIEAEMYALTGQSFDDIQVGAQLNDAGFLAGLSNMVNAAGMTASQATSYLSSMGVDATVKTVKKTDSEKKTQTGWTADLEAHTEIGHVPVVSGEGAQTTVSSVDIPYTVYSTVYTPQSQVVTDSKESTAFALEVTSANKSSGGNFKFQNSSNGGGSNGRSSRGGGGGGGGGKKCFSAGTLVTTSMGYRNIEDIQIGDIVLSYNKNLKKNEYSTVLQTMVHDTFEKIYTLYIKDDKIKVTGNHKMYVTRNWMSHWIAVEDMKIGDLVLFADGTLHLVEDIEFELEYRTVYNFEVSNNHNYYVGKNKILAHNKGGGGGKGKQPKQPKHKDSNVKRVKDKYDRYRDLNESIKKLNHTMSMQDKIQKHLSGNDLIKSLIKQNKLINQQRKNYTKLIAELRKERKEVQTWLNKKYGAIFKGDELKNYRETFNKIKEAYNSQVDAYEKILKKYNKMSAEQQEKSGEKMLKTAENNVKKAKEAYDEAQKYLKRYDEINADILKEQEEQKELLYQQIENNLQKFEIKYEMKLETREAKRTINEFLNTIKKNFKKTFFSRSEWNKEFKFLQDQANTYFNTKNKKGQVTKGTLQIDLDEVKEIQREINKGLYGENSKYNFASQSEAVDKLKEVTERLMEDAEAAHQVWQDFWDTYLESMDQTFQRWDDYIGKFDRFQQQLDHNKEIIDMLYGGGDTAQGRQQLDQYYNVSLENSLGKQRALNAQIQALKENRSKTTYGEKDYFKYDEQIKAAEDELDAEIENYMQLMQGQLENSVATARSNMDQGVWGKDFSQVQEEWNDKKKQAEGYYDEVQRIYQLEQLETKWKAAITSTSALKTQKQLTDLMERQQKSLSEKTKLSEKDVELAEKELEMYKAQIALEEAQTNKNTMKLTRDAQGNWSYQYIADQDDINQKQSDYLTKVDEWRTASINAAEEITEKIMSSYQEFSDRLSELMMKTYLSQDEMTTAYNNLYETYWGEDGIITAAVEDSNYIQQEANEATFVELAGLYEADEESFKIMTDNEQQLVKDLKDNSIIAATDIRDFLTGADHKSGITADIIEGAKNINVDSSAAWGELTKNIKEDMDGVKENVNNAYEAMKAALDLYDKAVKDSEEKSGIEWSKVEEQIGKVETKIGDTEGKLGSLIEKSADLEIFRQNVEKVEDQWDDIIGKIEDATQKLEFFLKMKAGEGETAKDNSKKGNNSKTSEKEKEISSSIKAPSVNGLSSIPSSSKEIKKGTRVRYKGGGYARDSYGEGMVSASKNKGQIYYISSIAKGHPYPYHLSESSNHDDHRAWIGWTKKDRIEALKTGGYTGSWNDGSGKLGILHSKELILNQSDTKNLLDAVGMIRDISSLGSSVSNAISNGLNRLMNNFNIGGLRTGVNGNIDNANKVFNITAEFPNANSVEEIQEAILSLPTLANQYISANN